jgi:hypothetical protein
MFSSEPAVGETDRDFIAPLVQLDMRRDFGKRQGQVQQPLVCGVHRAQLLAVNRIKDRRQSIEQRIIERFEILRF